MMAYHRDGYHSHEVTRGRWTVDKDGETIGQVRQGLGGEWYVELLPGEGFRSAAIERLIRLHEAQVLSGGHS